MELLKQPNRWSCLPTAMAMITDQSVDMIINQIGHDGSEILWPDLPEPRCRRSFHIQEMVDIALASGRFLMLIEKSPLTLSNVEVSFDRLGTAILAKAPHNRLYELYGEMASRIYPLRRPSLQNYLKEYDALILSPGHAAAWNSTEQLVYDPNGTKQYITQYQITQLWIINRG